MKKIIAWLLVVTLTATAAVGGTLAYLTDRDSEANVFTVGNVEIDLEEDFNQGATLIPGVNIEKEPTITNTGKNEAWVWATIAIPSKLDNDDASKNAVHFNMSAESLDYWSWTDDENQWLLKKDVDIDGTAYNVYTVLYKNILKPGETTVEPVIYKVYMDPHIDITPEGDWHHVEGGVVGDTIWNSEENGNPVIYVSAYAMQTDGFASAYDAYLAYNKQWTTEGGENKGLEWGAHTKAVSDAEGIKAALDAKEDVILEAGEYVMPNLDNADGLTISGADGAKIVPAEGGSNALTGSINNATLQNLTFEGSNAARWTYTEGDVVFEDCVFQGKVYGYHVDYANGGTITFNNCTFVHSGSYGHTNMWGTGYFTDCVFQTGTSLSGAGDSSQVYIDGKLHPNADLEF